MDEIEQILALYESKLDLPEEFFEDLEEMEVPEYQQPQVVARTENPLQNAMDPVAKTQTTRARTEKGKKGGAEPTKGGAPAVPEKQPYVPPPPADGAKVPPPAGMPAVKTFPISKGPAPNGMTFPGVVTAEP